MSADRDPGGEGADGRRLLKRASNSAQADVYLVGGSAGVRVRKDIARHRSLWRALWGRRLLRREAAALEATSSLEIGPLFLGWCGADAFEMSCVPGGRLPRNREAPQPGAEVFDRIGESVVAMHAAGVAHGDLRRTNIFWDRETGAVHLIDFGAAAVLGARPGPLRRLHFRTARAIDLRMLAKLRRAYLDGDDDEDGSRDDPWYLRAGRFARQRLYRPLKHLRERLFGRR